MLSSRGVTHPWPTYYRSRHSSTAEFILNPTGKSEICILHEYVQHALKVQPKYIYKELGESIIAQVNVSAYFRSGVAVVCS